MSNIINKLILFLYKRLIKRMNKDYENNKEFYAGEVYLKQLKTKINIPKALKETILIPDFYMIWDRIIDLIDNSIRLICHLIILSVCPFYNTFKLLIFPFRIYIVKTVRKEILKNIIAEEEKILNNKLINEFLEKCNKDFSNVEYTGSFKPKPPQDMDNLLFWYGEEVIREHGLDNFKIKEESKTMVGSK